MQIINSIINSMIKIQIVILLLVSSILHGGSEDDLSGLYFRSNYDRDQDVKEGTTLHLPAKGFIKYQKVLRLEFDIFFWRKDPFGFLLSAGNDEDPDVFVISYSDYKSADTSFIELTYQDRPSVISIPITDKDQGWKKWKHLTLLLEAKEKRIGLSFDNGNIIWHDASGIFPNNLQFRFGQTSHNIEPPRMVLKDIRINKDNNESLFWGLDENVGENVFCKSNNTLQKEGVVRNGIWMKQMHMSWRLTDHLKIPAGNFKSIGFDDHSNEYIFSIDDSLYFINPSNTSKSRRFPFKYLPDDGYYYFYDYINLRVLSMHAGGGSSVAYYDYHESEWKNFDNSHRSDDLFYQSSVLFDHRNGDLFSLGGYGWYEQKDILQKYDEERDLWNPITYDVIGETPFFPRSNATSSFDTYSNRYIIFGGGGNESGKQQQGFRELNDLWTLDLTEMAMRQLWKDNPDKNNEGKNFEYIIVPKHKQIFRINVDGLPASNFNSNLFSTTFDNKEFQDTGIKMFPRDGENENIVHKGFLENTNGLLVVTLDNRKNENILRFHLLSLPIIMSDDRKNNYAKILGFGLLTLLGVGIWVGNNRSKKVKKKSIIEEDVNNLTLKHDKIIKKKGITIYMLDRFRIWIDGKEVNYSDWKSIKARKLFLYILLKNSHGASISEINSQFWPDVKMESARNSRSVALNRIRNTIEPYGDLIKKIDDRLILLNTDMVYIDYHDLLRLLNDFKKKDMESTPIYPIDLYGKAGLLPEIDEDWVDLYRIDLLSMMCNYSKRVADHHMQKEDWGIVEWIGKRMLFWNHFNDDGLYFSVLSNKKMNKVGLSHQIYDDFSKKYENEMGEPYPSSYDSLSI